MSSELFVVFALLRHAIAIHGAINLSSTHSSLFLLLLNAIVFLPSCDLLPELAPNILLSGAINPGKAVDRARDIDGASSNPHPAPDEVAGRRTPVGAPVTIVVLNHPTLNAIMPSRNQNFSTSSNWAVEKPSFPWLWPN